MVLGPYVWFCIVSSSSSTSKHKAQVLISSSVPSSSAEIRFIIKTERGKEETKKNILFEGKKRTAKDKNATIASFNELVVTGMLFC